MAILGSTAKPTPSTEWYGLNTTNQFADLLTLPAGGPWNITKIGTWLGGQGMSANYKLCLWSGSAALLRSSATGTVGSAITSASMSITPYEVAGGTSVYVGFSRDPADSVQLPFGAGGSHLHDYTGATWPATMSGWTSHTGTMGVWLEYEASNRAPNAPTLTSPANGARSIDTTPTLAFTHSDPDGDALSSYDWQISLNSGFTSLIVNQSSQTTGKSGNTVSRASPTALTRGATYYWRARTRDAGGLVGAWSAARTVHINDLPTVPARVPVSGGLATIHNIADAAIWDQTVFYAKPRLAWTFDDDDGDAQNAYRVRIYDAATLGNTVYDSGNVISSAKTHDAAWAGDYDTTYWWTIEVRDAYNEWSTDLTRFPFKMLWSQVIYDYAVPGGASSSSWNITRSSSGVGQIAVLYRTATGPGGTGTLSPWNASIGALTPAAYLNVMVRLAATTSGSGPVIDSMSFTYLTSAQFPDKWAVMSGTVADFTLDPSVRRFGEKSLKCAVSTTTVNRSIAPWREASGDDIRVSPATPLIFSAYVRTGGALKPGAYVALEVYEPGGATPIVLGHDIPGAWTDNSVNPDTADWQRLVLPFNSGGWDTLRFRVTYVHASGVAGDVFWIDGAHLEVGSVVSPWTPGMVSDAVVLDNAGVQIDAASGGIFRLRSGDGAVGVTLGTGGLVGSLLPTFPDPPDLLFKESWATSGGPLTMAAGVDQDLPAGMSVTYPGNPAMVGRKVIIRAYMSMSATYSAVGEINLSLMTSVLPTPGDGSTRLRFTQDRIDSGGAKNQQDCERTSTYPADAPVTFSGRIRTAAASTVTVYASATSQYVSRIGYQVLGYI